MSDSVWKWSPGYEAGHVQPLSVEPAGLSAVAWAASVKPQLVELQRSAGIPAMGAAAQAMHEAFNPGGQTLSVLAANYNNFYGMKWAEWMRDHGGRPVSLSTWEEINGDVVNLDDAFASFPDLDHCLAAYADLLHFGRYVGALRYASQPLLWLNQVVAAGYATDSRYLAGPGRWMSLIWDLYADTLLGQLPVYQQIPIVDRTGRQFAAGWLMDPDGPGPEGERTVVRAREIIEAVGLTCTFDPDRPAVEVDWPGTAARAADKT